jgi:hypothetical protein
MQRRAVTTALRLDFGETTFAVTRVGRGGLRLATPAGPGRGPDKYRILDLKRRRAQIRARRVLGLG